MRKPGALGVSHPPPLPQHSALSTDRRPAPVRSRSFRSPALLAPIIDRRNKDSVMGLGEHLEELRRRVVFALAAIVPLFGLCLYYGKEILEFLLAPVKASLKDAGQAGTFLSTGLLETFGAYVKVSAVVTLVVAGPWAIYQLWKFVAPGLYSHEKRFAYVLAPLSIVMSAAGAAFAYYVMLPVMLIFLVAFGISIGKENVATLSDPPAVTLPMAVILAADRSTRARGR